MRDTTEITSNICNGICDSSMNNNPSHRDQSPVPGENNENTSNNLDVTAN